MKLAQSQRYKTLKERAATSAHKTNGPLRMHTGRGYGKRARYPNCPYRNSASREKAVAVCMGFNVSQSFWRFDRESASSA